MWNEAVLHSAEVNYISVVQQQQGIDPDSIFGRVPRCVTQPNRDEVDERERWKELFESGVGNVIYVFIGHVWHEFGWRQMCHLCVEWWWSRMHCDHSKSKGCQGALLVGQWIVFAYVTWRTARPYLWVYQHLHSYLLNAKEITTHHTI